MCIRRRDLNEGLHTVEWYRYRNRLLLGHSPHWPRPIEPIEYVIMIRRALSALFALVVSIPVLVPQGTAQTALPASDERTRWFREAKFGMFIHWGAYSVIGRDEWARNSLQIPQAEYDRYARRFNPVNFNPDGWVDLARRAGVKYMVITSKHHDGFSIFRSRVSDYGVAMTPYQGDPLKMLSEACARKGMRLGFYHSIMDWHHPDYRPRRSWESANPKEGGNLDRYLDFMRAQIRELLTGYGPVAVLWFDGEWEHSTAEMRSNEIFDYIRTMSPGTLINDRLFRHEGHLWDFGTPEQFVPATGVTDAEGRPALWESCVTINNDSWGYNKYETEFKTSRDLIRMLVEVVSKGGNLLLNVGPTPDGRIQDEFVTRLNAIGQWLDVNGEAVYGTTASPFPRLPFFGRATVKGSMLYLHVFQFPAGGRLRVPGLKNNVISAKILGSNTGTLRMQRDGDDVLLELPAEAPDETATVIAVQLDGAPVAVPWMAQADKHGAIRLGVESCEIETKFGQRAGKENLLGHVFLTRWTRADDVPTWRLSVPRAGRYAVDISYAAGNGAAGTDYVVTIGKSQVAGKVKDTEGGLVFKQFRAGEIRLEAGETQLQVKPTIKNGAQPMRLERVTLTPL
jgi:alpha-L-fucosidase